MARATRIALDLALVSVKKIQPAVSRLWGSAKDAVVKTPAKPLVCNVVVTKVESILDKVLNLLVNGMTTLRNKQLPREEEYLEKELVKVRQRMSIYCSEEPSSQKVKPAVGSAWQYAKTEIMPPMTLEYFHGAAGKKLEDAVGSSFNRFISGLQQKIKDIELEEIRARQAKEAAVKVALEKSMAAAKAKEEETKKEQAKKQKEIETAAKIKSAEEAKKVAKKPKEPPKVEKTAKKQAKKEPPKPVPKK